MIYNAIVKEETVNGVRNIQVREATPRRRTPQFSNIMRGNGCRLAERMGEIKAEMRFDESKMSYAEMAATVDHFADTVIEYLMRKNKR